VNDVFLVALMAAAFVTAAILLVLAFSQPPPRRAPPTRPNPEWRSWAVDTVEWSLDEEGDQGP